MKIRKRDGSVIEVSDSYIMKDGEAMVVPMQFMDGLVRNSRGMLAGQRPGILFSNGNRQAEQAVADAYREYDEALGERWKTAGVRQSHTMQPAPTFDSAGAALADAYAQYDRDLSERWRNR